MWAVWLDGEHKASSSSSAGGIPLFPPQQPSGEQQQGSAGWAAAVRVMVAGILRLLR